MASKATRAEKNSWMLKMLENTKLDKKEIIMDFMTVFNSTQRTALEVWEWAQAK